MSIKLSIEAKNALADKDTIKALATVDKNGDPHVVFKGSLHLTNDGLIEFYEILESSQTNSNLVGSIWFGRTAAINLLTADKKSYQIKAKPVKSIASGHYFEAAYVKLRESKGDIDLGAIWQLEPIEEKEQTFAARIAEDEAAYPLLKHLDRILKD
ncbi:MAG: hypothetical protein ACI4JJ_02830 [Huintestinicola sp.]